MNIKVKNNSTILKIISGIFLAVSVLWSSPKSNIKSGVSSGKFAAGEILIQYKNNITKSFATRLTQNNGHMVKRTLLHTPANMGPIQLASVRSGITVEQAIAEYSQSQNVASVQPNYIYHKTTAPNDLSYGQLWGLKNTGQTLSDPSIWYTTNNPGIAGKDINAEGAWAVITDCSSAVVAVVDTGINYTQEDLASNMASGSYTCPGGTGTYGCDFVGTGTTNPMDLDGHGTHVAGTIGAKGNNAVGTTGVCQTAKILAVRVLDATGSGYTSDIVEGVNFAAGTSAGQGNAKVINMSLGGAGYDSLFESAIANAQSNDVVVVVAAGNSGMDHSNSLNASYPCDYSDSNIICVAAADQSYNIASFSDYDANSTASNRNVDIGAPGTNIESTYFGTSTAITGNGTTTTTDDFTTGWTYSAGTGVKGTSEATTPGWFDDPGYNGTTGCFSNSSGPVPSLISNYGFCYGGAPAISQNRTVYKTFNLSGSYAAIVASFYVWFDLSSAGDIFNANFISTSSDPFVSGTNAGTVNGPYHSGGFVGPLSADISTCNTATCTLGFQYITDTVANSSYDGIGIIDASITGQAITTNAYTFLNGTSMATPHVAGIATMVRARNPDYTYADVVNAILGGGDPEPAFTSTTKSGNVADAYGSLKYIPVPTGVTLSVQ